MLNLLLKPIVTFFWWLMYKRKLFSAVKDQHKILFKLINKAKTTQFGQEHNFKDIKSYEDYKKNVPIRHYVDVKPYLDKVVNGEMNVLWPEKYSYLLATGTTTGDCTDKFIPLSQDSIKNLLSVSFKSLLNYAVKKQNYGLFFQRGLYLAATPKLGQKGGYSFGPLSGITHYLRPKILRNFNLPSYETAIIEDWEIKIEKIEAEIINHDLGLLVGTPPWLVLFIKKLRQKVGVELGTHFKSFKLLIFGGAPINLYKKEVKAHLGSNVTLMENYPAAEGFIGFQDEFPEQGFLLAASQGIFFEFIKKSDYYNDNYERVSLEDIELNVDYAIVLNTDSGLFGYIIGDIVSFSNNSPYRIYIKGRLRHYVYLNQTYYNDGDLAIPFVDFINKFDLPIEEFTFSPDKLGEGLDLFYECKDDKPMNNDILKKYANELNVSFPVHFKQMKNGSVYQFMKMKFKVGGQFKLTRVKNDRSITDHLEKFVL